MPQSYKEYPSGSVTLTAVTYDVPFKYLSIDDVNVIGFDGDSWTPLTLDASAPRSATNKTVTLATAPNALYTKIRLYRASSTTQLVDFQNGSRLSESDLDTAYQQGLFAAQEIAEDASTSQFAAVRQVALQAGTSLSNFKSQEFTGDGTALFNITAFAPATVVNEAYRVSIDGVMQAPSDYTVRMSPADITFTSAPPTGSKIVVVTAASAASSVSVDDATIGLTSTNKAQIKNLGVTNAKLAGGITQDKLAGGITNAQLAGSITQDKLAGLSITNSELAGSITQDKLDGSIPQSKLSLDLIDDDTMTTGVSATSLASSESIKAYVDASAPSLSSPTAVGLSGTASSNGFLVASLERGYQAGYFSGSSFYRGKCTAVVDGHTYQQAVEGDNVYGYATMTIPIRSGASWSITKTNFTNTYPISVTVEFHALS